MPTVLVVDDEPTIRLLIRAALEGTGYHLLEAGDGPAALEVARGGRPDLILLDLALPQLGGLEVCRRLKDDPVTAHIAVLFLTGVAQLAERVAAQDAGAEGLIAKPFKPADLRQQVADTLRAQAAFAGR